MSENNTQIPPTTYRSPRITSPSTPHRSRTGTGTASDASHFGSPYGPDSPVAPSPYLRRMGLQVDEQPQVDGTYNIPTSTMFQSEGYLERALASHKAKQEHLAYLAEAENDATGVVEASRVLLPETPPSERAEEKYGRNEGCFCLKKGDGLSVSVSEMAEWPILGCGVCGTLSNCVDPWRHDSMPEGRQNEENDGTFL